VLYISIVNEDGKLSQQRWAAYCAEFTRHVACCSRRVIAEWHALPGADVQSACVLAEVAGILAGPLRRELRDLAGMYGVPDPGFGLSSADSGRAPVWRALTIPSRRADPHGR